MSIRGLDFESQLPAPTTGTLHITITDGGNPIPAKQIQIHTNQTVDLNQSFLLTPNTATNTVSQISEFAEGGSNSRTNSSYSARDPSGTQVISVTAQSRETLTEVAIRLRDAINAVTDLPTNFTAEVLDNNLLLKPTSGLVDLDWRVVVNHGAGNNGNISFTHSRPNDSVPTSGQLTLPTTFYNVENGEVE